MGNPAPPFVSTSPNYSSGAPDGVVVDQNALDSTGVPATKPRTSGDREKPLEANLKGPKVPTDYWGIPVDGAYTSPRTP
jgi:hypothetical protein